MPPHIEFPVSRGFGAISLILFFALLIGLPIVTAASSSQGLAVFDSFYRAGALILVGVIPFWDGFRKHDSAQALMRGANAAVVGILGAALYDPVFTSAIVGPRQFALALTCFVLLMAWKAPPWLVVLVAAAGGVLIGLTA